ncbi:MAG TPA: hypothetical protein VML55_15410 [Planctomycetaceae bacterium]|nr:hypothetical protein [Planctomycetaceae bacterium]
MGGHAFFPAAAALAWTLLAAPGERAPAQPPGSDASAAAAVAPAQADSPPRTAAPPPSSADPDDQRRPRTADLPLLPAEDGRLVPVVPDGDLEEYLKFLEEKRGRQRDRNGPEYSVSMIGLEGRAGDDSAELTATIEVQIDREDTDVLVPLALGEARLVNLEHKGPGDARFDRFDRHSGYRWWFRGQGRHTLTLSLLVDIQKQPIPTRRISLSIPEAAVSYLRLRVPVAFERLSILPTPDASARKTALADGGTQIAVFARERINLAWQSLPEFKPVETVLQSETAIRVEITGESVLLSPVTQRIRALEGSFDSVGVWLPAGFEVLELALGEQVLAPEPDAAQPGRVTVRLPAATSGPIELRWRMRAAFPADGRLQLDGFRVDKALSQRGEITVHAAEGYGVSRQSGESVHRINVSPASGDGRPLTAYSFWKQPFSLALNVQQVPPYFTADPYYFVLLRERRAQLVADLWFDVHEGAVDEVRLKWPGLEQQGWVVQAEPPGLVERTPLFDADSGTVQVQLIKHQSQGFRVTVRAERDVPPGGEPFDFELPGIVASSPARPVVVLANAHNVESTLQPAAQTTIRSLGANLREKATQLMIEADLPDDYLHLRRTEFRAESEQLRFSASVTVHSQQIDSESLASVTLLDNRLEVIHEITYHVAYEPLSQVRIAVPAVGSAGPTADDLSPRFAFLEELDDGTLVPMRPNWSGLDDGVSRLARCALSEPRIGVFRVVVRHEVPVPAGAGRDRPSVLRLPVIHAAEGEPVPVRVRLESNGLLEMRIDDPSWTRQFDPAVASSRTNEWTSDEPVFETPLTLAAPQPQGSGDFHVSRSYITTLARADGTLRCVARFRFDGAPAALEVRLPSAGADRARFWWDRRQLAATSSRADQDGQRVVLTIPTDQRTGSRLLTVESEAVHGATFGLLERQQFVAPQISGVWVDHTLWRVALPEKQHIVTDPAGLVPRYRWVREGLFWSRRTPAGLPEGPAWIGASAGPEFPAEEPGGYVYEFTRFGAAGRVQFRTMSSAALIAFGAGFAWAAGFVLLTVPAARNVLTVLSAGLAVALAAAWFPAAVGVLLQPILLGLGLAAAAAAIDAFLRRKRIATVLTFSSPSDYAVAARSNSSVDRPRSALVGSNEATAMRPTSSYGPLESLAAPESGSRT